MGKSQIYQNAYGLLADTNRVDRLFADLKKKIRSKIRTVPNKIHGSRNLEMRHDSITQKSIG